MSSRPDAWFSLYPGDHLRDTMHLSAEEEGAYWRLMLHYYVNGALPDNDERLAQIVRLPIGRWKKLRPTIAAFFPISDGVWRHKRIELELAKMQRLNTKRSAAGAAGAEARWGQKNVNSGSKPDATAMANASCTGSKPDGKPHGKRVRSAMANACDPLWQIDGPLQPPLQLQTESVVRPSPAPAPARETERYPHHMALVVSEEDRRWAIDSYDHLVLEHEVAQFVDHYLAKGEMPKDVSAAWRKWIRLAKGAVLKVTAATEAPDELPPIISADIGTDQCAHWLNVRTKARELLGNDVFKSWIAGLALLRASADEITLGTSSPFKRDRVERDYHGTLEHLAKRSVRIVVGQLSDAGEAKGEAV